MKSLIKLYLLFCFIFVTQLAHAQLSVHLKTERKEYLVGEQITMKLTLSNNSDQSLVLDNTDARKWLHFSISSYSLPTGITPLASPRFPKVMMTPGSTRTFELDIKPFFNFNKLDFYTATATIRMPDGVTTYSSNRTSFSITNGSSMTSFNIQHKGKKLQLHTKLLQTNKTDCLFGQVIDSSSNTALSSCYLGRYLNFMKPIVILDRNQNMHMLCQSTPKYYTYAVMNTEGKRVKYQIYRRTNGPIDLIVTGAGVTVVGAIPHIEVDKKDGFHNVHSATDRIE